MNKDFVVFTDGASKGNPGSGGWAAIVANDNRVTELGGKEARTTNNRMELRAAIEALSFTSTLHLKPSTLILYTDSAYLVNGITKWVHGWQKNGWRTVTKKDVENKDLWERLVELTAGAKHSIEWKRIAGHADTLGNARADKIASAFGDLPAQLFAEQKVARVGTPKLFSGPRAEYKINLEVIGTGSNSQKSSSRNRGAAYSYVSMIDKKIMTHKTWKECETRVKGKRSACYKKALSLSEEKEIISEFSR